MPPDVCPSPNPALNIQVKLLHQACLWFGGEHRLAEFLGVTVELVNEWLNGERPVPDRVFLACLDVVRPPRV
jgi:DNA-binding transcriptional regulator YdaS (Cro superfamily)